MKPTNRILERNGKDLITVFPKNQSFYEFEANFIHW